MCAYTYNIMYMIPKYLFKMRVLHASFSHARDRFISDTYLHSHSYWNLHCVSHVCQKMCQLVRTCETVVPLLVYYFRLIPRAHDVEE